MKVLYIAPFRDMSGYATAARGYLAALQGQDIEVAARSIRYDSLLSTQLYQPNSDELFALHQMSDDVDVVIQHTTPNELRITDTIGGKTNIAVVAWETNRIPEYWVSKLNHFDAVVTFCDTTVSAFKESGVKVPVHKIPHCFRMSKYGTEARSKLEPLQIVDNPAVLSGRHIFYNISQLSHKKGIDVLLQSYYHRFWEHADSVGLVLKLYVNNNGNRDAEEQHVTNVIKEIRQAMRLPKYPPVFVITDIMTDEQIERLHLLGDTYVCSSRGEGWNIPAFEALAYGNSLVTTLWGGMAEFATGRPGVYPVEYSMEPLIGQHHADPSLYTARDLVAEPSIRSMGSAMAEAMANKNHDANLEEYDYSVVGDQFVSLIKDIHSRKTCEVTNV